MTADIIQARYDQLDNIANRFSQHAENTTHLMQQVQQGVDALRQSGWEGQGAVAFLAEMETAVFPILQRLINAQEEAGSKTLQIKQIIQLAEEAAAHFFNGKQSDYAGTNIFGFRARDTLLGNAGDDILSDGTGDDILSDGTGDDTLSDGTVIEERLGTLSEKYETGGRGPGTVSSGKGDAGGVSYGTYQMTSKDGGTVAKFLASSEGSKWAKEFKDLKPGSPEFTAKWKEIAQREPEAFRDAQHAYIKKTHYDPLANNVKERLKVDLAQRSKALRDVVWSTSVQHGSRTTIIDKALKGKDVTKMSDAEIINAIYAERSRTNSKGELVYFQRNSTKVQKGVASRFQRELQDALGQLEKENTVQKSVP